MGVLSDRQIRERGCIRPLIDGQKSDGIISYGLSSYGYDIRVDRKFKLADSEMYGIIDPKRFNERLFVDIEADECVIPPHGFVLAESVEIVDVPRDTIVVCVGKSTYARCGIIVNVTPLEPEWCGRITLEISNTTPLPAKIYAGEGIAQLLFLRGDSVCETSYADRKGRYQGQEGLTLPFVRDTTKGE